MPIQKVKRLKSYNDIKDGHIYYGTIVSRHWISKSKGFFKAQLWDVNEVWKTITFTECNSHGEIVGVKRKHHVNKITIENGFRPRNRRMLVGVPDKQITKEHLDAGYCILYELSSAQQMKMKLGKYHLRKLKYIARRVKENQNK